MRDGCIRPQAWIGGLLGLIGACVLAPAAFAQSASTATTGGTDTSGASLEEIVVTAEKLSVDVMHAPVSVTAINGDTLKQNEVHGVEDLQFFVPGLTAVADKGGGELNIRGVGSLGSGPSSAPGVPTYRDGVLVQSDAGDEPLWDVANVQVLRGPQGTLVGASSTGGAMFISTVNPKIDDSSGYAQVEGGSFRHVQAEAAINLPISSSFAARVGLYINKSDGPDKDATPTTLFGGGLPAAWTTRNHVGDTNAEGARASLLWQPNDNTSVLAKVDYYQNLTGGTASKPFFVASTQSGGVTTVCPAAGSSFNTDPSTWSPVNNCGYAAFAPADPHTVAFAGVNQFFNEYIWRESVEGKVKLFDGGPSLRALIGQEYTHEPSISESSASEYYLGGTTNDEHDRMSTYEVDVLSPDNHALQWVVGGFYAQYFQDLRFFPQNSSGGALGNCPAPTCGQPGGGFGAYLIGADATSEHAVFANLNYSFNEQWKIEGGVRHTWHHDYNPWISCKLPSGVTETYDCFLGSANAFHGVAPDPNNPGNYLPDPAGNNQLQASDAYSNPTTWKAAVDYNITPTSYTYLEVATGQKAGGTNAPGFNFDPEKDINFELGWKSTLLDGHLSVQSDAFYMRYTNMQVAGNSPQFGGHWILNAPTASIYGLELASQLNLNGWDVSGSADFTKSRFSLPGIVNGDTCGLYQPCNNAHGGQCAPGQADGGYGVVLDSNGNPVGPCFNYNEPGAYINGQYFPWIANIKNQQLPFSPTFQASVEVGYRIALGESGLTPRAAFTYMNSQSVAPYDTPLDISPARTNVDLKLAYDYEHWVVEAFLTNATNKTYVLSLNPGGAERFNAPREWGVRATKSW